MGWNWEGLPGGLCADNRRPVPADMKAMLRKAQWWSCICTEDHNDIIDVLHSCVLCVPLEFLLPDSKTSIYMKTTQGIWIYFYLEDDGERRNSPVLFAAWRRWESFWDGLSFRSDTWCDVTDAAPFMDTSARICACLRPHPHPHPAAPKSDLWWSELFQTETQGIDIA